MIDPADLQAFLAKIEGGTIPVDLFKIGQNHHQHNIASGGKNSKHNTNFRVALDIEDCLDRFYGGYYSDWACGGQWNRAYQFVQLLANAFKNAHVEVVVFFDGTLKKNKKLTFERNDFRQRTIAVLKHIRMIGTPPPKIWWLPPSGIRTTLRNALRSVNIQVAQTVNDHTMEIIEYFHDNKLDGILGLHPDYIIANTSRYFSSHDLRLSYKGALETKEFMVTKLLASLSLTADHLPFVAVFLGGYILIDEIKLKNIHERLKIDISLDYEARIRKLAEIVRNSPTTDIDEFIKHLNLAEFENDIKESVEYYQRKGKFLMKSNQRGGKRRGIGGDTHKIMIIEPAPFASETNDDDEDAKKILNDVSNLVEEESNANEATNDGSKIKNEKQKTATSQFVYTLPGEVIKTSLNRHQRGIMDSRIYQLLTRKEIILPQILEDELYREIPSVHLFYRPARQMIYAILFNLYHQKYLCSKKNSSSNNGGNIGGGGGGGGGGDKKNDGGKKDGKKDNQTLQQQKPPEIQIAEWIWSPTNDYKKPDIVTAIALPWAVPTIQRLWFGMAYEDKQRRMKAFLTIMRSDSPLMLNRGYVPQHMLVMACVLRYIVTSPDRNILTRQELDAFLATAFSPQLPHVEYTQELVLPGVHLRGVYLATLFMQGVETASLANDACGVPLPWTMTNPWLFFDGKLFHLKLKMSTIVTTLRELCDDHIEIVLKIERFRKAILEDVEHFLLPAAHMDPMYRPGFLPPPTLPVAAAFNKTTSFSLATAATAAANNAAIYYNTPPPYFSLTPALLGRETITGVNPSSITTNRNTIKNNNTQQRNNNNRKGYQLKVGGIVTGSWAAGGGGAASTRAAIFGPAGNRLNNRVAINLARFNVNNRGKTVVSINNRLQRIQNQQLSSVRNGNRIYTTNKLNTTKRNRQKRKEQRKSVKKDKKEATINSNTTIAATATAAAAAAGTTATTTTDTSNTITATTTTTTSTSSPIATNDDTAVTVTAIIDNPNEINDNVVSVSIKSEDNTEDEISEKVKDLSIRIKTELQNGSNVPASDLVNSICDELLKEDNEESSSVSIKDNNNKNLSMPSSSSSSSNDNNNKITTTIKNDIDDIVSTSSSSLNDTNSSSLLSSSTSSVITTSSSANTIIDTTLNLSVDDVTSTTINSSIKSQSGGGNGGAATSVTTTTTTTSSSSALSASAATAPSTTTATTVSTIKNSSKTGSGKKSKAKKNGVTIKTTNSTEQQHGDNSINTSTNAAGTTTAVVDDIGQSGDVSVKG